jgi:enoyl-CoA hydratase/carnithine racemase
VFQSVNWKPVVDAVHGYVLGLGLGIVLNCDLIAVETGTQFQLTETSRGRVRRSTGCGLTFAGSGFPGRSVMTGRYFAAEEALAANLINRVAPKDTVMEAARMPAVAVAANPLLSVRATVRARRWFLDRYAKEAAFQQAPMRLYLTEDFREAALAFKEKHKPGGFQGR